VVRLGQHGFLYPLFSSRPCDPLNERPRKQVLLFSPFAMAIIRSGAPLFRLRESICVSRDFLLGGVQFPATLGGERRPSHALYFTTNGFVPSLYTIDMREDDYQFASVVCCRHEFLVVG